MRTISRRRLRIPHSLRFILFPLISVFVILAAVIYGRRSTSEAFPCLTRQAFWFEASTGKRFVAANLKVWQRKEQGRLAHVHSRSTSSWVTYGQRQAFIEFTTYLGKPSAHLVINSPGEGIHREFDLSPALSKHRPEYVWAKDGTYSPSLRLSWSPNGRYVLLEVWDGPPYYLYYQPEDSTTISGFWRYSLFDINGEAHRDFQIAPQTDETPFGADLAWTSDGRLSFASMGLRPFGYEITVPQATPGQFIDAWIPIPVRLEGKIRVVLMRKSGSLATEQMRHTVTFVEGADSIGRPNWSPDGQWIATVWAAGQGSSRVVRLSWMNVKTQVRQTLDDHLWDVRDIIWLADGQSLAYIALRDSKVSVEIADLNTGKYRVIRDHLEDAARLSQNPATGKITFWWRDKDRSAGIASYTPNGQLLHEARLIHSLRPPGLLEVFRNPYEFMRIPEIYPSPDGSRYVISAWRWLGELISLQLVAADGSWSKDISLQAFPSPPKSVIYISNILWSPDSKRFLVAYRDIDDYPNQPIDIWSADGTPVSMVVEQGDTGALTWNACN
jgi:WD40 repeat protein